MTDLSWPSVQLLAFSMLFRKFLRSKTTVGTVPTRQSFPSESYLMISPFILSFALSTSALAQSSIPELAVQSGQRYARHRRPDGGSARDTRRKVHSRSSLNRRGIRPNRWRYADDPSGRTRARIPTQDPGAPRRFRFIRCRFTGWTGFHRDTRRHDLVVGGRTRPPARW